MAMWQFDLYIVPKEVAIAFSPKLLDGEVCLDQMEDVFLKLGYKLHDFDWIREIFKDGDSWHDDIKFFGDNDSHCFRIDLENGFVYSIMLRIDFTASNWFRVLEECVSNLEMRSLILFDLSGTIVATNLGSVIKALKVSDNYQSKLWKK